MPKISPISWKEFEKFLFKVGCEFKRQSASHRIYWKQGILRPIVIPARKSLPIFVIRNNLRLLGISQEEYLKVLHSK